MPTSSVGGGSGVPPGFESALAQTSDTLSDVTSSNLKVIAVHPAEFPITASKTTAAADFLFQYVGGCEVVECRVGAKKFKSVMIGKSAVVPYPIG